MNETAMTFSLMTIAKYRNFQLFAVSTVTAR
jgi:hypothetical protein